MQKAEARFMVHRQRGWGPLGCLTSAWKCPSVKREPVSAFSIGLCRIHQEGVAGPPAYITGPITPSLCITLVILAVFNFSQLYGILETHKPTVNASLFRTSCEFMSFTSVKGILRFTHRPPTLFVALEEERDIPNRDGLPYNSGDAFSDLELQQIGTERGVGVGDGIRKDAKRRVWGHKVIL